MPLRQFSRSSVVTFGVVFKRHCSKMQKWRENFEHPDPFKRTCRIVKNDLRELGSKLQNLFGFEGIRFEKFIPTHTDVLVIGDGVLGNAIAQFMKQRAPHAVDVIVLGEIGQPVRFESNELRQNFILPENIQMSQFCGKFLKKLPGVQYHPHGFLHLADASSADDLLHGCEIRNKIGSRNVVMTKSQLAGKFPWLNLEQIEVGCLGLEQEGLFNPYALLKNLYAKNLQLDVKYLHADVVGFNFKKISHIEKIDQIVVEFGNNELHGIKFAYCILAPDSKINYLAALAKINQFGELNVQMPFTPRERFLHVLDIPNGPGLDMPVVTDSLGFHFHRDGFQKFVLKSYEPDFTKINLKQKFRQIDDILLTQTIHGFEEFNEIDKNGIIGPHPIYHNLYLACGFDTQHAPAVARAVMELILDGEYSTINLSRFAFDRILLDTPGPQQMTMLPIRAASKSCLTEFTQRVMSGKLLQLKQYQNQLNEAVNQLHVAREENKALTRLLKRHEASLKRYEGENAGMPRLLRSHAEEVRTLRTTVHQLRTELREHQCHLREKDAEVVSLKDQITKLRNLGEINRVFDYEKAQKQIEHLQALNEEQTKEIQLLSRRILLETKTNQRILHAEISKHKETKKQLNTTLAQVDRLEAQKKAILFGYTGNGLHFHQCLRTESNEHTRRESLVPVLPKTRHSAKQPNFRPKQENNTQQTI